MPLIPVLGPPDGSAPTLVPWATGGGHSGKRGRNYTYKAVVFRGQSFGPGDFVEVTAVNAAGKNDTGVAQVIAVVKRDQRPWLKVKWFWTPDQCNLERTSDFFPGEVYAEVVDGTQLVDVETVAALTFVHENWRQFDADPHADQGT